jgi:transcriptional regulator with XRE-family HTH domain
MDDTEERDLSSAFVDRLRAAASDTSQAVIAKRAQLSTSAVSKIFQGAEPGLFKAVRLAKALGVNLNWLATGVGRPNAAESGFVEIPLLDVQLAAGTGAITDLAQQIGVVPMDREMLRALGRTSADGLRFLEGAGDSMVPLIFDGSRVLVDTHDTRLREGVFAFRLGDDLRVKRLRRLGVDGIEVLSENPRYEPEVLSGYDLEHFAILGRVLGGFNFY